jgi:hypothetical protein
MRQKVAGGRQRRRRRIEYLRTTINFAPQATAASVSPRIYVIQLTHGATNDERVWRKKDIAGRVTEGFVVDDESKLDG